MVAANAAARSRERPTPSASRLRSSAKHSLALSSRPEVERLASYCTQGRLVAFTALSGLRQGEVFALRRSAVDLPKRIVRVEGSARAGAITKTKTGRKRVVDLTAAAVELLAEQLAGVRST